MSAEIVRLLDVETPVAPPPSDTILLARVAQFEALHRAHAILWTAFRSLQEAAEADPECPPHVLPVDDPEGHRALMAFIAARRGALCEASEEVAQRWGRAANAVFNTRAITAHGLAAKLRVLQVAYGTCNEDGDDDLLAYQRGSWLGKVIADAERMAAPVV